MIEVVAGCFSGIKRLMDPKARFGLVEKLRSMVQ